MLTRRVPFRRRVPRMDRHRPHRRRDPGRGHQHRGRFVRWRGLDAGWAPTVQRRRKTLQLWLRGVRVRVSFEGGGMYRIRVLITLVNGKLGAMALLAFKLR